MANQITIIENKTVTPDIVRKNTKAYQLAKLLSDGRRKPGGVSRKEIMKRLDIDPAVYAKLYGCFEVVERGKYRYTGKALQQIG